MANINIEFDGKIYSVDENTLAPLASPLERALIQQFAGTGAVIRFGGTNYNVNANKLASARNVLTDHFSTDTITGSDSKVIVNGIEYGLSKTKLQAATDKMNETLSSMVELPTSEGLAFRLNDDSASYSVVGIGTCTDNDVVIPATYNSLPVVSIGYEAFRKCNTFSTLFVPDSVINIEEAAFIGCTNLVSIRLSERTESIGARAFRQCPNLTTINTLGKINSISDGCFYDCSNLESIIIPNSVSDIEPYAFIRCKKLTDINIPDSVSSIGSSAFAESPSIINVTFGAGLESIEPSAFANCPGIENISVSENNTKYHSETNCMVETQSRTLILGCRNSKIPSDGSVEIIGTKAFSGCKYLNSITIPSKVSIISDYAFNSCTYLNTVIMEEGVTIIGGGAFTWCEFLYNLTIPKTVTHMHNDAFLCCNRLDKVRYNGGIDTWCAITFGDDNSNPVAYAERLYLKGDNGDYTLLTNLVIPPSVTSIPPYAFDWCRSLVSIVIPQSVVSIGTRTFGACNKIESISYEGTIAQCNLITFNKDWNIGMSATYIQCTDGQVAI